MKAQEATNKIVEIILQLDTEEDFQQVLKDLPDSGGTGQSSWTLEEYKQDYEPSGEALQEQRDSHGLEGFIPNKINDPEWDPQGPEDGGHPY